MLSRRQLLVVVKKHAGAVRGCKRLQPGVSGVIGVALEIATTGHVIMASVVTGKFKDTKVGDCVAKLVRTLRFPRFSGKPMRITVPFAL